MDWDCSFKVEAVQAALPKGVEVRCHFGDLDETEEELKSEKQDPQI